MIGCFIVAGIGLILLIVGLIQEKHSGDDDYIGQMIEAAGLIILFLGLIGSISVPLIAKQECAEFEQTRIIIIEAYEYGDDSDNYAISQSVIEANNWLAEAKASKQTFGIFSKYWLIDLDSIEPIRLPPNN